MTIILEDTNQVDYLTDLSKVITPFKDYFRKLNWLLTDLDYIILDSDKKGDIEKLNHEDRAITYTGEELLSVIETREIQFVWGVLSGFSGEIPKMLDDELPCIDIRNFFTNSDNFQVPTAEIEILCFDSSSTMIKFKDIKIGQDFMIEFPDAKEIINTKAIKQNKKG